MYHHSPILGAIALSAFLIFLIAVAVYVVSWYVDRFYLRQAVCQSYDEREQQWSGEPEVHDCRPRVRSMAGEIHGTRAEDLTT